jgi:8-oxo-dGTP diphosphatase
MSMKSEYTKIINSFAEKLPHFSDGRIDYTNSKKAPVLNCFVEHGGKYLLMRRSGKVTNYNGLWNSIAGFLDDPNIPLEEAIKIELDQELKIAIDQIDELVIGNHYKFFDETIGKTWIIFPALAKLKNDQIELDWEHTEFVWVNKEEIKNYDTVPRLSEVLEHINA